MQYRRLDPGAAFARRVSSVENSVRSLETQATGTIVVREQIIATDRVTGEQTIIGTRPDGSVGLQEFVNDTTPPGRPSTPTVQPTLGGVFVSWNGLEADGAEKPRDYERTSIEYTTDGVNWVDSKTIYGMTNTIVGNLEPNKEHSFRLVSYDRNGNRSAASGTANGTPNAQVDNTAIDEAIDDLREENIRLAGLSSDAQTAAEDAADVAELANTKALEAAGLVATKSRIIFTSPTVEDRNYTTVWIDTSDGSNTPRRWDGSRWDTLTDKVASDAASLAASANTVANQASSAAASAATAAGEAQIAANGKNKTLYSTSAPPAGAVVGAIAGDTWFRKDANEIIIGQWEYSGSAYVSKTVGNALIAAGIDAGKISVGTLDANRIGARSISVDKLLITSSENVIQEPDFSATGASWGRTATVTFVAAAGRAGGGVLRFTGSTAAQTSLNSQPKIPIDSLSTYRGQIVAKSSSALAIGTVRLIMRCYTTSTAFTDVNVAINSTAFVANTWTSVEYNSTTATGKAPTGTVNVQFLISITNPTTATVTDVDYVSAVRAADGKLIVDGAIDGKIITGALIQSKAGATEGIKLSDTQFVAYTNGVESLRFDGTNSMITGAVIRTATTGRRVQMDQNGLKAYGTDNAEYFNLDPAYGVTMSSGQMTIVGTTYNTDPALEKPIYASFGNVVPYATNAVAGSDSVPGLSFQRRIVVANGDGTTSLADDTSLTYKPGVASFDGEGISLRSAQIGGGTSGPASGARYSNLTLHPSGGLSAITSEDMVFTAGATRKISLLGSAVWINNIDVNGKYCDFVNTAITAANATVTLTGTPAFGGFKNTTSTTNFVEWASSGLLRIKETGVYAISLSMSIPAAATGRTFCTIAASTDAWATTRGSFAVGEDTGGASTTIFLTAGTTVQFAVFQTTGASRTVRVQGRIAKLFGTSA